MNIALLVLLFTFSLQILVVFIMSAG